MTRNDSYLAAPAINDTSFPPPDASDATRAGYSPSARRAAGRQVNLRDIATRFPPRGTRLDNTSRRSLPTPTVSEATRGYTSSRDSRGKPRLTAALAGLLPTPLAGGNRKSRSAIVGQACGPGLEQAVEMILGMMPSELMNWTEAPPSWTGVRTRGRSIDGS